VVTGAFRTVFEDCESLRRARQSTFVSSFRRGDKVVVLLHATAKVLVTGKPFESDIIHFFTIRDGKIASLLDFFDTAAMVGASRR
jgi:ketosteroid isomerase-like protein